MPVYMIQVRIQVVVMLLTWIDFENKYTKFNYGQFISELVFNIVYINTYKRTPPVHLDWFSSVAPCWWACVYKTFSMKKNALDGWIC